MRQRLAPSIASQAGGVAPLSPALTPQGWQRMFPDAQPCILQWGGLRVCWWPVVPGLYLTPALSSMAVSGLVLPWWHFNGGGGAANLACQPPCCTPNKPSSRICLHPPKTPAQKDGSPQTRGVLGKKHGAGRLPQPHWSGGADIPVGLAAKLNPTGDSGWVAEVCEQPRASGRLSPCPARPGGAAGWGLQPPRRGCREKPQNLERTKPAKRKSKTQGKQARGAARPPRDLFSGVYSPFPEAESLPGPPGVGPGAGGRYPQLAPHVTRPVAVWAVS